MRIAASRRLGFRKTPVGASAFVGFYSTTFFCARKMLRIFLIGRKKTSHTAGTLNAITQKIDSGY
jgi:hypothetical protein